MKYKILFFSVILTLVVTLAVGEIDAINTASTLSNGLPDTADLSLGGIAGFLKTYWGLLTFNIDGVPAIVSLIFIPIQLVVGYIIGELLVNVIPFT